jgi:hypothetical protein
METLNTMKVSKVLLLFNFGNKKTSSKELVLGQMRMKFDIKNSCKVY